MLRRGIQRVLGEFGYTAVKIVELEEVRNSHSHAMRVIEALRAEADMRDAEVENIIAHRDQIASSLARQNDEFHRVLGERNETLGQNESLSDELAAVVVRADQAERQVKSLRGKLKQGLEAIDRIYEKHVEILEDRGKAWIEAEEATARAIGSSERADEMSERADEMSKRANEMSERADEMSKQADELSERAEALSAENGALVVRLQESEATRQGLEADIAARAAELDDARANASAIQQELERKSEELRAAGELAEASRAEIDQLTAALAAARDRVNELEPQIGALQASADEARRGETELRTELDEVRGLVAGLQKDVSDEVAQVLADHEKTLEELAGAKHAFVEAEAEIERLRKLRTAADDDADSPSLHDSHIVIAGLPFSRSESLAEAMRDAAEFVPVELCNGYFPNDLLSTDAFLQDRRCVAATYLDASPRNLDGLKLALAAVIVHVSDPRLIVARRTRLYFEDQGQSQIVEAGLSPPLQEGQFTNASELVDWQIENFVPLMADWIQGWIEFFDKRPNWPIILMSEADGDNTDRRREIAATLGVPDSVWEGVPVDKDMNWTEVLSDEQAERTIEQFDDKLRADMAWR
ncbi:MAG: hypothetical protein ABJ215_00665 [Alphaproteobacteria bacterium]